MKIKPILFNTEMVKAILDDRKTQTRRFVKYNKGEVKDLASWFDYDKDSSNEPICFWFDVDHTYDLIEPYVRSGDILWVRETWNYGYVETSEAEYSHEAWFEERDYKERGNDSFIDCISHFYYKADDEASDIGMTWRPSLHMPKEAARIFLRVNKIKVERLQDISESDINAEGSNSENFKNLWNSTIKKSDINKYSFEANPLVWVYEFERCEKPEEFLK